MAFKDILLQLTSYPEPTPVAALDQAVAFAAASGARISALAFEIVVNVPGTVLAPALLDVRGLIAAEQRRSAANARALIETFASAAERRGVAHEHFIESCENSQVPEIVTEYARLSDVTMIPVGHEASFQQFIAETVIFGSGRATIVFPAPAKRESSGVFDRVGIAWDFSRPAARELDLLVMGAYGHSRMREFILGGATKFILVNAPVPVLLSH